MQQHTQEYERYLRSREWQAKRLSAFRRTQNRCEKCGIQKHKEGLAVHHKTYERLGHELDSDLMVLCNCVTHKKTKTEELKQQVESIGRGLMVGHRRNTASIGTTTWTQARSSKNSTNG